mgnify:FL=1
MPPNLFERSSSPETSIRIKSLSNKSLTEQEVALTSETYGTFLDARDKLSSMIDEIIVNFLPSRLFFLKNDINSLVFDLLGSDSTP